MAPPRSLLLVAVLLAAALPLLFVPPAGNNRHSNIQDPLMFFFGVTMTMQVRIAE
jgi:hypothetical protein